MLIFCCSVSNLGFSVVTENFIHFAISACVFIYETNCLSFLCSMAATNADKIEALRPRPIDDSVFTLQAQHRSDAVWNRQVKHNTKTSCYVLSSILHMVPHFIHRM